MSIDAARQWFEGCAFHAFLGLELRELSAGRMRVDLPLDARLTNNGAVLHGGVAAALAGVTSRALWLAAGGRGTAHSAALHVSYLAAAAEDLHVDAFLLRSGRNVCFVRTELRAASGTLVAEALATLRLRAARTPPERPPLGAREIEPDPPLFWREVAVPFLRYLGIEVVGMGEGASRVRLPWRAELADGPGLHEGALLALLDCAGAMSAHAACGVSGRSNATVALQAQIFGSELPAADSLALGRCALRDHDLSWNEIRLAREAPRDLLGRGSVVYRIEPDAG